MFYVISYDIPNDRRRSQLAKVLKGFGTRVQYSVFEAHLNRTQYEQLKRAVARVIDFSKDSVLLKRMPTLAPVVLSYADMTEQTELDITPTEHKPTLSAIVKVYSERVDHIFGRDFLEQHQLRNVLIQLEKLRQHAESLGHCGEPEFALIILYALIRQSIARYPDTLQKGELPRFVNKCTKTFAQIAVNIQQPVEILYGQL